MTTYELVRLILGLVILYVIGVGVVYARLKGSTWRIVIAMYWPLIPIIYPIGKLVVMLFKIGVTMGTPIPPELKNIGKVPTATATEKKP